MNRNPRHQQHQVALPNASDMGTLIVRTSVNFVKRHKVIASSYVLGLLVMLLVGGGTKLTMDQQRQFNHIMSTIDLEAEYDASHRYAMANGAYRASKGWFWQCDDLCQRNKKRMEAARDDLEEIRAEGHARMSDAKAVAGLFSEVGVGQVKDSFWQYFNQGKQFAKRQSMWDAMFMGIRSMSRDESTVEYVLRVLMQVLVNFSLGLLMSLAIFVFGLWGIIRDYQPNPAVAVLFFILASCAAFAFVASYLLALYGAAAGSLYGAAKLAESSQRQRLQEQQRQGYVYNRPHYQ